MPPGAAEHPLLLQALEAYVRVPLEGTWADENVFAPCKRLYLELCRRERLQAKFRAGKMH